MSYCRSSSSADPSRTESGPSSSHWLICAGACLWGVKKGEEELLTPPPRSPARFFCDVFGLYHNFFFFFSCLPPHHGTARLC
ncbi:hypothetical protein GDO81_014774 [Engystomops pustulosus]|uniref:Uncharacterized protein n=1 Tax=Engystomops pustulosus TaxID=76066 RepID=A0AAV7AGZ7_ENGPU|nr:hypothetical protein GDO81_014774 [Engystomops pustulosus]